MMRSRRQQIKDKIKGKVIPLNPAPLTTSYNIGEARRVTMLRQAGFVLDVKEIWRREEEAIGHSSMLALCDEAFCRYLRG